MTISLVVIPAISGVPVPGANAGSRTSISIDKYKGLLPTLVLILSADVVEVSPAYDHAEVTSLAAATIVYELTNLFAKS